MASARTRSARWPARSKPSSTRPKDKLKIEAQERERNAGSVARQKAVDSYVAEFESTVRQTLQQLGDASGQMRKTSTACRRVPSDQ